MVTRTDIIGEGLISSPLWSDTVSVPARWLFICLLLRTDDEGEIRVDEEYRIFGLIAGLGIQSSQRALAELERAKLVTICGETIIVNRVRRYRYRQTKAQALTTERTRKWRHRNASGDAPPPTTPPDIVQTSTGTVQNSTSTVREDIGEDIRADIADIDDPIGDELDEILKKETREDAKARVARIREETGFNDFWALYGKKTGTKRALTAWKNLTKKDREAAMEALPAYIRATPDTRFRKNPSTWIHQRCWEDEMVAPQIRVARQSLDEAGEIDF